MRALIGEPGCELERYDDLATGDAVMTRMNDAGVPAGARGVVVRRVAETGNWLVRFDLPGGRRVVALCPWQVRPESVDAPPSGPEARQARRAENLRRAWRQMSDPAVRSRAMAGARAFHRQRQRAIEAAGEKRCGRCGEMLPLAAFARRSDGSGRGGYQAYCRACCAAWRREQRAVKAGSGGDPADAPETPGSGPG
ncbi:MAG: hypothetical protein ACR2J8_05045, partial [Thermomicrobiales bacterium]